LLKKLDITIICSSKKHPIYSHLKNWMQNNSNYYNIILVNESSEIKKGDILFLISCTELISLKIRNEFKHTLVIHESDLPKGRGWSPLIWQILDGANEIIITLLEAEEKVDSGNIWKQHKIAIEPHEIIDEINTKVFSTKLELIEFAIKHHKDIKPKPQRKENPTYYKQRTAENSKLDIDETISQQFDLLRVADNIRYPCFFDYRGHRYKLTLTKLE
jgi:methionyl-tRNA formyltransferase